MAKRFLVLIMAISVLFVFTASVPAPAVSESVEDTTVIESVESVASNVQKARFENMLDHNYLYGEDFESDKIMIENSILALLDKSENGQIEQGLVLGFIAGMYGRQVDPSAAEYEFLSADDGMFAILARGYDAYDHTITEVEEIEGGYLVSSDVTVSPSDGFPFTATAKSIFVENEGSAFGYNLTASFLSEPVVAPVM